MPRSDARVGTLDGAGRKLAVYERGDGSLYIKPDGVRENVHGNAHWTHTSGTKMRGRAPLAVPASVREPVHPDEEEELERAIAASLEDAGMAPPLEGSNVLDNVPTASAEAPAGSRACVVCLTNPADRVIKPCRHLCLCGGCALRYQRSKLPCPICRKNQRSIERIFLA